jgi:tripartite-type tricarboxylate transporter receptor subunit TctC
LSLLRVPSCCLRALRVERVFAFAFAFAISASLAADYPSKQIRIVVPYPPGGFNDTLARTLAEKLHAAWGRTVIVDNRPGGGTTIGANMVAKAPPDGHTLLIVSFAFAVNPNLYRELPYDTLSDFAPVVLAAGTPNILVVNPKLPAKSVGELVALSKSRPGGLNYASAGNGASNHLSMELFKSLTGANLVHVAYRGSAPAVTDLLGGQVDVMFDNTPNVWPHVKAGKLRALAVSSGKRSAFTPELPTLVESGVRGFDVAVWFGVVAPRRTPATVIETLNSEINRILKLPEVKELFRAQGVEPQGGSPAEFGGFIRGQIAKWAPVVKSSGARAE